MTTRNRRVGSIKNELVKSFEAQFDKDIKNLSILKVPIRVALGALYGVVDCLFHGARFSDKGIPSRPDEANAALSRLSYLVPLLLHCPVEPLGHDAWDVFNYIRNNPNLLSDVKNLLEYAHFSEIMPEVHRKYYEVAGNPEEGFVLSHKDPRISAFEACDILLTELALPMGFRPRAIPKDLCNAIARTDSFDVQFLIAMFGIRFHELLPLVVEPPVLTEEGFQIAIGTDANGFRRFRAAWFAIADCSLALAEAYAAVIADQKDEESPRAWLEFLEWRTVFMKSDFLLGVVQSLSNLNAQTIDRIMRLYSIQPGSGSQHAAGDGYFPPFWWLADSILFSPDAVLRMLSSRNIPFALNQLDRSLFNNSISAHLEPSLVDGVRQVLQATGAHVVCNKSWTGGEFDLLAYDPRSRLAIQVQVKGAIAAQGARMTRSVESRTREAISQLNDILHLSEEKRYELLSTVLSIDVTGCDLLSLVTTRAGIGTWEVWKDLNGIMVANLQMLHIALARSVSNGPTTLRAFAEVLQHLFDEILYDTSSSWEQARTKFHEVDFEFPILRLEKKTTHSLRREFASTQGPLEVPDMSQEWAQLMALWNVSSATNSDFVPNTTPNKDLRGS